MPTTDTVAPPLVSRDDVPFGKLLLLANGAVPVWLLAWDAYRGQLGVNAVNSAIRTTGLLALLCLLLSLVVTPLRRLTGWGALIAFRRLLGLYAFFYLALHFSLFFGLDRAASVSSTVHEIVTRRYLQVGTVGLLAMVPLAVTSTDAMIQRLGARRWKALHRLAYVAAIAGSLHYYLLVKADVRQPLAFAAVLALLLVFRVVQGRLDAHARPGAPARPAPTPAVPSRPRFWSGELRVARIFDETPDVRTFRLTADGNLPFDHRPGQYLSLALTIDGRRVARSYTIASPPTRSGYCELTVKREPGGVASAHLHESLREGSVLRVSAPAGRFVFDGTGADGVVLLAGGVGITPLMAMVRYLTDRGWPGQIRLLCCVRTGRDVIFAEELAYLQRRFPTLRVLVTVTRDEGDAWSGARGRVSAELLTDFAPELARWPVYVCGPDAMMTSARQVLAALGVPPERVHTEAFVSPAAGDEAAPDAGSLEAPDAVALVAAGTERERAAEIAGTPGQASEPATVRFERSGLTVPLRPDQTLLEAAEEAGVDLPFECRSGICGQCKTRLVAGEVTMDEQDGLTAVDRSKGLILACQARARRGLIVLDA